MRVLSVRARWGRRTSKAATTRRCTEAERGSRGARLGTLYRSPSQAPLSRAGQASLGAQPLARTITCSARYGQLVISLETRCWCLSLSGLAAFRSLATNVRVQIFPSVRTVICYCLVASTSGTHLDTAPIGSSSDPARSSAAQLNGSPLDDQLYSTGIA